MTALLFDTGSDPLVVTLCVLLIVPAAVGFTTMLTSLFAPFARVPRLHVTVVPDSAQPDEAETNVTPEGKASVSTTFGAAAGPLLVTMLR